MKSSAKTKITNVESLELKMCNAKLCAIVEMVSTEDKLKVDDIVGRPVSGKHPLIVTVLRYDPSDLF